jgi:hypothetical protein
VKDPLFLCFVCILVNKALLANILEISNLSSFRDAIIATFHEMKGISTNKKRGIALCCLQKSFVNSKAFGFSG